MKIIIVYIIFFTSTYLFYINSWDIPKHSIYIPWKISTDVSNKIEKYELLSLKNLTLPMLRFIRNEYASLINIKFVTRNELVNNLSNYVDFDVISLEEYEKESKIFFKKHGYSSCTRFDCDDFADKDYIKNMMREIMLFTKLDLNNFPKREEDDDPDWPYECTVFGPENLYLYFPYHFDLPMKKQRKYVHLTTIGLTVISKDHTTPCFYSHIHLDKVCNRKIIPGSAYYTMRSDSHSGQADLEAKETEGMEKYTFDEYY